MITVVDRLRRKKTNVVVLVLGLALLVAGTVTVLIDRIVVRQLAPAYRMPTLPVFQYEQDTDTETVFQRIPDDSVLLLAASGTAALGLAVVAIALALLSRTRPTKSS